MVWLRVDESSPEKHIEKRDNLDVAEDAADRFGIHNDKIGAPNLDAKEVEPANDEQARQPETENDAENHLPDVNQAPAARYGGEPRNLRPRNTLRAPNSYSA